jgi:short-subunit dehydrogenase
MPADLQGHTALVTGASSGIGADLARVLAARGANLVLAARRAEALEAVAASVRSAAQVSVQVRPIDLLDERARTALHAESADVDILVNNAGLGVFGPFADAPWERTREVLELNLVALTHLTQLFLPGMLAARWGRVMLVASTAAFQPVPNYAVYAASKAHVLSFGMALNQELKGTGVSCTTLNPGVTATEFFGVAGQTLGMFQRRTMMQGADVARVGVDAMVARRASVTAGAANAMGAFGTRLIPRGFAAVLAGRMNRPG